jgi:catechol 2,3-dioxygenase
VTFETAPRDPEEVTGSVPAAAAALSDATTMGAVHLTVADLGRSIPYYERAIGLRVLEQGDRQVSLGAGETILLVLGEEPGARPALGYTGLYHFAIRVPERRQLAAWLAHAARDRVPLLGLSDHFVSEAIYLTDPDQHGIEIYRDRPRTSWAGIVERMGTWPLDVQSLLGELADPSSEPFDGLPASTVMGHVHFKVATMAETVGFYRDVLGFGLMAVVGGQAAFLSVGGYHHHVGANTWESAGARPPPEGTASLRHATILLPTKDDLDELVGRLEAAGLSPEDHADGPLVRDPSGNRLLLTSARQA